MSTIATGGSGLDIAGLASQLVQAARMPADARIKRFDATVGAKLSAVGQIKSSLTSLQSALQKLGTAAAKPGHQVTLQDGAGFTAIPGAGAAAGSYVVEVLAVANAQKLASGAHAADTVVGTGTLSIAWGSGEDQSLAVEFEEGATLSEIARAVNRAADGKGVTATIITANDGQHLVFTAKESGLANALDITASGGDGGLLALTNGTGGGLVEQVAASDARVRVDGFERTSASNAVADLVQGVSLNLVAAKPGESFRLEVAPDNKALESAAEAFVSAYNSVGSVLRSTTSYNAETKSASALTGDSLVRGLQQQLRNQVSSNTLELKELGITIDKTGVMSLDKTRLGEAMAVDPQAMSRLFGEEGRIASPMQALLKSQLNSTDGALTQRTESLNRQRRDLEDQLSQLDLRMEKLSSIYLAQFTAMETMIIQLQGGASSLNSLLAGNSK